MVRLSSAIILFLACTSFAGAESYEDRWVRLANEHLAMVKVEPGKSYEVKLIKAHNTFWHGVYDECRPEAQKQDAVKFHAVMVIDAEGKVVEFLTFPHSAHFQCFEEAMVGRHYPEPPTAPFYELIDISLPAK